MKRAKAIKLRYIDLDNDYRLRNNQPIPTTLIKLIDKLYQDYTTLCWYSMKTPLSKGIWLSQDVN